MSNFTAQEVALLQQFRSRISDVLPSNDFSRRDDSLIRWIRARDLNLDKAEEMFRNSIKWRADNQVDTILGQGVRPDIQQKFPYFLDGVDRKGRPVVTLPYGEWDVRTFIEAEGPEPYARYMNQYLEDLALAIKRSTKEIEKDGKQQNPCVQYLMISDMSGYEYRQLANVKAVQSVIQMVSVFEAHYPETMGTCMVINAPAVFSVLFGMLKPFMSGRTVDKIKVFGDDKEKWEPVVHQLVDPSQIRQRFGGTKD